MADLDGTWTCAVESPMGDQSFTLVIQTAGSSFTGRAEGGVGSMDIEGEVDGDTLAWPMRVSKPMPVTLNCKATIDGDTLSGKVSAGIFGSFPLKGERA